VVLGKPNINSSNPVSSPSNSLSSAVSCSNSVFCSAISAPNSSSDHFILDVKIISSESYQSHRTYTMVDSGAMSSFIDLSFAQSLNLVLVPKSNPVDVVAFDGKPAGTILSECTVTLEIGRHSEIITLDVTNLGHYPIILGMPWLKLHDPSIIWSKYRLIFNSAFCHSNCFHSSSVVHAVAEHPLIPVSRSSSLSSVLTDSVSARTPVLSLVSSAPSDSVSFLSSVITQYYFDFLDVFSEKESNTLPLHGPHDHQIPLVDGKAPPFGPIYPLSRTELQVLSDYLKENLEKGFIRPSSSPAGAPILFVKKKDGSLRLCVDYRGLNKITIKNRYPLPLINELLDRLSHARVFTKLDIRNAYNRIRIASGDEWKTAFRTRYGHFEYLVMPFGLTNAPASFQSLINNTLREYLDVFAVVYLDDILIFSSSLEQHINHVRLVLERLRNAGLYVKGEKCEFHVDHVEFLGFCINPSGVTMDPKKVSAIMDWPSPKSLHDVQSFLGFANFYRRFIHDYSRLSLPLTSLLKKGVVFQWTPSAQNAFDELKKKFSSSPLLCVFDPSLPCVVESDASDFAIGAVLNQLGDDQKLRPIAFFSRKLLPAEVNYDVHDKELLSIVECFKLWRHYLEDASHQIIVYSDHINLQYFMGNKPLNRRQARWALALSSFNFAIQYRPGTKNARADALSRRPDFAFKEEGRDKQPISKIFEASNSTLTPIPTTSISASSVSVSVSDNSELRSQILKLYSEDPDVATIFSALKDPKLATSRLKSLLSRYSLDPETKMLLFNNRVYIPQNTKIKLDILNLFHDSPVSGHPGRAKTLELVSRQFFWPGIRRFVNRYVFNCPICRRSKPSRQEPSGHLLPLNVPERPWSSISMDFITGLPVSDGHNAILVVVDRFSKMSHFIPCFDTITAKELSLLFLQHVFRLHGLPKDIVSDRGPVFTSKFWQELLKQFNVKSNLSTAFHPQTDGQTERINSVLEQYLRIYVNYQQDNWSSLLPFAEFSYNNAEQSSTQKSPFFSNYGYHPSLHFNQVTSSVPASDDMIQQLHALHEEIKSEVSLAQQQQALYYNQHRRPTPDYKINDSVFISARNISTLRPSKKLDHKQLGPFKIIGKIGSHAYRLDLPDSMKIHPVFHVSLLSPASNSNLPDFPERRIQPPPPIEVKGQEEWVVREILDSRRYGRSRKLQYLVAWEGFPDPSDNSWEPASNLEANGFENSHVREFHAKYPRKPR
jgi:hypothetical protein